MHKYFRSMFFKQFGGRDLMCLSSRRSIKIRYTREMAISIQGTKGNRVKHEGCVYLIHSQDKNMTKNSIKCQSTLASYDVTIKCRRHCIQIITRRYGLSDVLNIFEFLYVYKYNQCYGHNVLFFQHNKPKPLFIYQQACARVWTLYDPDVIPPSNGG